MPEAYFPEAYAYTFPQRYIFGTDQTRTQNMNPNIDITDFPATFTDSDSDKLHIEVSTGTAYVDTTDSGVFVTAEQAPAVALAILEAAKVYGPDASPSMRAVVTRLRMFVRAEEAKAQAAEKAKAQAAEEAKAAEEAQAAQLAADETTALNLLNAHRVGLDAEATPYTDWDKARVAYSKQYWTRLARATREAGFLTAAATAPIPRYSVVQNARAAWGVQDTENGKFAEFGMDSRSREIVAGVTERLNRGTAKPGGLLWSASVNS